MGRTRHVGISPRKNSRKSESQKDRGTANGVVFMDEREESREAGQRKARECVRPMPMVCAGVRIFESGHARSCARAFLFYATRPVTKDGWEFSAVAPSRKREIDARRIHTDRGGLFFSWKT